MLNQPSDGYLHALKPIYGFSESPRYWWQTFKRYHSEDLEMDQSTLDPCLFYRKCGKAPIELVRTLADDTLAAGNHEFSQIENEKCKAFDKKPREQELPLKFYGVNFTMQGGIMMTEQYSCIDALTKFNPNSFIKDQFSHLRGQVAYAAQGTRQDLAYSCAQLSQTCAAEANNSDAFMLNEVVEVLKTRQRGIMFPKLDLKTACIRGYAYVGFASNTDFTSQLGMIILLMDAQNTAAIIHYSSWKSRRVVRSPLAAEVYALSAGHDYCTALSHDLAIMLETTLPIYLMTDSKSIFDTTLKP